MRVTHFEVNNWRNIADLSLEIPAEASLVCLVGENGAGKSNVLQLLSAVASQLGLAHGIDMPRGDPLGESHQLRVTADINEDARAFFSLDEGAEPWKLEWSGRVRFNSNLNSNGHEAMTVALDIDNEHARLLGESTVATYRARTEICHLYLDSDRAYPSNVVNIQEYAQALEQDYGEPTFARQWSFRPSRTMYSEWIKYMLSVEQQVSTDLTRRTREAQHSGSAKPDFEDPFHAYAESVRAVLPHLDFQGVDSKKRTLIFKVAGTSLPFAHLSGGEREIAFLLGQIDRFKLRRGLLLIDEPELHLNPDLLRLWLSYLRDTVENGQVWIATHSLEAAEVAGAEATFVLHRDPESLTVLRAESLANAPALALLSASVGSPAFSLLRNRFILIEGERQNRERARFHEICGENPTYRFMEVGNCQEVLRRLDVIQELATDLDYPLTVGGVVDRDFRTLEEIATLESTYRVHVLKCDEVENLFLQPEALLEIAKDHGLEAEATDLIRETSDKFAGKWGLRYASARVSDLPNPDRLLRQAANEEDWNSIASDLQAAATRIAGASPALDEPARTAWCDALGSAFEAYERIRTADDLWKMCLGKECLRSIPGKLGLTGPTYLEQRVRTLWHAGLVPFPEEAKMLMEYVATLTPA